MAKKIPKVRSKGPVKFFSPGSGLSWEDKLYMLAGGLSPFGIGRKVDATKLGRAGRLGLGSLRFMGLTNPWFAIPAALTGAAKYAVGKAFDPYRDETGRIGTEGSARLTQERIAREARYAANTAKREGTWLGKLDQRMLEGLRSAGMSEGGIARLL